MKNQESNNPIEGDERLEPVSIEREADINPENLRATRLTEMQVKTKADLELENDLAVKVGAAKNKDYQINASVIDEQRRQEIGKVEIKSQEALLGIDKSSLGWKGETISRTREAKKVNLPEQSKLEDNNRISSVTAYENLLLVNIKQLRAGIKVAENKRDEADVLQKESKLKDLEILLIAVKDARKIETEIDDLKNRVQYLRSQINIFEKAKDENKVLNFENDLRQVEIQINTKKSNLDEIKSNLKQSDSLHVNNDESLIMEGFKMKSDAKQLDTTALSDLKNKLLELIGQAKKEEKKHNGGRILELEAEIRLTENEIEEMNKKISQEQAKEDVRDKIKKIRQEISLAERKMNEDEVLNKESQLRKLELDLIDKKEETISDVVETKLEVPEEKKYNETVSSMLNKLGIDSKKLDSVEGFSDLSVFIQGIIANSLSFNSLEKDELKNPAVASSGTPSKSWLGKKLEVIKNIFTASASNKETLAEKSQRRSARNSEELKNLVDLVRKTNFIEMKGKDGLVKIDFLANQNIDTSNLRLKVAINTLNESALKVASLANHEIIRDIKEVNAFGFNFQKKMALYKINRDYEHAKSVLMQELMREKHTSENTGDKKTYSPQEASQLIIGVDTQVNQLRYLGFNQKNKERKSSTKLESKKFNKESSRANSLIEKLDSAIIKTNTSDDKEKIAALGSLQRRIDYSKDLANRDLIYFGKAGESTRNMLNFYDQLEKAQMKLVEENFDYKMADLSYNVISKKGKKINEERYRMQERSEALLKKNRKK